MIVLYLIASIFIALMLTSDIFILVHPHLSIKKYTIFFFSFSVLFFIQTYLNFSPMLFAILVMNSALLVKFTKKLYSFFYIPLGYILNCIVVNLITFVTTILWDISTKELNADKFLMVMFFICTTAVSCPILYLIRLLFQKYFISIFEKMNKKLLTLITLTILLCAFMLFTMASFFDNVEITRRESFLMVSSLILYFLFTISMILFVLHTAKKNYETQKKVEYLENLNEYTKNLEIVYNNLRSFKHDYINIMASLTAYIDEKKYDEMEVFFMNTFYQCKKILQKEVEH